MGRSVEVRPLQVWADNDPRHAGRTIQVLQVVGETAICRTLTNSNETQATLDRVRDEGYMAVSDSLGGYVPKDMRGRVGKVHVSRFRPTSSGYRLLGTMPEATDGPQTYEQLLALLDDDERDAR